MTLPRQNSAWVDGDGRPTRDLYNWARSINVTPQASAASSYALGDLTNVRLSGISDGDVLTWSNTQGKWVNSAASSSGYAEGTAFPSSPTTGDKFYRTDLNWLCFYDGTRWLTCQEFSLPYTHSGTLPLDISDEWVLRAVPPNDFAAYYTKLYLMVESSGTAHNGSNFIVLSLSTTSTTLATISTSSGIPSNSQVRFDTALNIACPLTDKRVIMTCAVNGTISNTFIYPAIFFRMIVT